MSSRFPWKSIFYSELHVFQLSFFYFAAPAMKICQQSHLLCWFSILPRLRDWFLQSSLWLKPGNSWVSSDQACYVWSLTCTQHTAAGSLFVNKSCFKTSDCPQKKQKNNLTTDSGIIKASEDSQSSRINTKSAAKQKNWTSILKLKMFFFPFRKLSQFKKWSKAVRG